MDIKDVGCDSPNGIQVAC